MSGVSFGYPAPHSPQPSPTGRGSGLQGSLPLPSGEGWGEDSLPLPPGEGGDEGRSSPHPPEAKSGSSLPLPLGEGGGEGRSSPHPPKAKSGSSLPLPLGEGGGEGKPIIIVHNVSKSVLAGQRIGILGANGQGKSTLVKTIARDLQPIGGEITEGKGLNIGYFAQQELDVLRPSDTPLEHMIRLVKDMTAAGKIAGQQTREQDLRSFLGTFNFSGDMVKQSVGSMSGGEKARLVLCMMVWQRPNLLLMDEPTNHLDLATREALAMALNEFEGTLMLVSHDRALLRSVCDEFWMVSRGGVEPFDGDLDDYQRYLLDEAKRQREAIKEASSAAAKAERKAQAEATAAAAKAKSKPAPTGSLKRKLQDVEARMTVLNTEGAALEGHLSKSPPPSDFANLGHRLKEVNEELQGLEEQWLEVSEQIESATA
jgi:ATP-binding cassette subfamily F protein 3